MQWRHIDLVDIGSDKFLVSPEEIVNGMKMSRSSSIMTLCRNYREATIVL